MSQLPSDSMTIDVVDAADQAVGRQRRSDVFVTQRSFRVAHVFLFNSAGELLLQQLSDTRDRYPLHWGSSVAAYLFAGESYEEAATRRLKQELGVTTAVPVFHLKTVMDDSGCSKFISLFATTYDGVFDVDRANIAQVEFHAPVDISRMIHDNAQPFTPTFLHLFDAYYQP